jgi:hypothetical protein
MAIEIIEPDPSVTCGGAPASKSDDAIGQALADSFPASDAPPWTLGISCQTMPTGH